MHPAYWALDPEADHKLAHASGGSSDADNLTTLHTMCNTRKSSLAAESLPKVNLASPATEPPWDDLGVVNRGRDAGTSDNPGCGRGAHIGAHKTF